jgi:hypothetical protein
VFDVFDVLNVSNLVDILVDRTVERKRLTYRSEVEFISSSAPVGIETLCYSKL